MNFATLQVEKYRNFIESYKEDANKEIEIEGNKIKIKIENSKVMFMVIKSAFMQRRKTLLNALTNTKVFVSKEEGTQILKTLNLNENVRAEELSLQDFANITKMIMGKEEQK